MINWPQGECSIWIELEHNHQLQTARDNDADFSKQTARRETYAPMNPVSVWIHRRFWKPRNFWNSRDSWAARFDVHNLNSWILRKHANTLPLHLSSDTRQRMQTTAQNRSEITKYSMWRTSDLCITYQLFYHLYVTFKWNIQMPYILFMHNPCTLCLTYATKFHMHEHF